MMAEKASLFNDFVSETEILNTNNPAKAQRLGRKVNGFTQNTWVKNRFEIVVNGNLEKFSQNNKLKTFLLNTGNKIIVEASPNDSIWGVGLAESDIRITNPGDWNGLNLLGFALMEVRERLR